MSLKWVIWVFSSTLFILHLTFGWGHTTTPKPAGVLLHMGVVQVFVFVHQSPGTLQQSNLFRLSVK